VGFGRGVLTVAEIRQNSVPYVGLKNEAEKAKYDEFWKQVTYFQGQYNDVNSYTKLQTDMLTSFETGKQVVNHMFYFAIPPDAYETTSIAIHGSTAMSKT
jgi:glucose-6-phosphate 1-dehydrogenase